MQGINNLTNPFKIKEKDALYCLSSSAPVPSNVENDIVMTDDEIDKKAHKKFWLMMELTRKPTRSLFRKG